MHIHRMKIEESLSVQRGTEADTTGRDVLV